ncbi:hypothetical protein ETI06_13105 [Macrococcoides goetzii]|nr:hypothetical protein [Macrococcus goetzii]TDM38816.1 hypothetical protein ETI10_13305 [Macrococcus goetzii]TDM45102.1 hypothetical protein ETI06_13105 [Macrococcus goetzii]
MNDDNLITVVGLADNLGVAKQTVFYNAKKLGIEPVKIDHVSYVTIEQSDKITERINSNKPQSKTSNKHDDKTNVSRDNDMNITDVLLEQLRVKDEQIKQLNNTLDEQQRLLSQQQSLQLQSNEKIKALEIELNEIKEDINTTDVSVQAEDVQRDNKVDNFYNDLKNERSKKQSQSFLSRLFKR